MSLLRKGMALANRATPMIQSRRGLEMSKLPVIGPFFDKRKWFLLFALFWFSPCIFFIDFYVFQQFNLIFFSFLLVGPIGMPDPIEGTIGMTKMELMLQEMGVTVSILEIQSFLMFLFSSGQLILDLIYHYSL